jgi:hypothetical protein
MAASKIAVIPFRPQTPSLLRDLNLFAQVQPHREQEESYVQREPEQNRLPLIGARICVCARGPQFKRPYDALERKKSATAFHAGNSGVCEPPWYEFAGHWGAETPESNQPSRGSPPAASRRG